MVLRVPRHWGRFCQPAVTMPAPGGQTGIVPLARPTQRQALREEHSYDNSGTLICKGTGTPRPGEAQGSIVSQQIFLFTPVWSPPPPSCPEQSSCPRSLELTNRKEGHGVQQGCVLYKLLSVCTAGLRGPQESGVLFMRLL